MRGGVRRRLKFATERVHEQAEHSMDLRADIGSAAGYQRFLRVMALTSTAFAEPLDESSRLAGLRPRSAELAQALALDLAPGASCATVGDACERRDPSYVAGVGYTLEGSAMGASVLRKRVPQGMSTHYLDALLSARRDRWTHYSRWLDDETHTFDLDAAELGAAHVFEWVQTAIAVVTEPAIDGVPA